MGPTCSARAHRVNDFVLLVGSLLLLQLLLRAAIENSDEHVRDCGASHASASARLSSLPFEERGDGHVLFSPTKGSDQVNVSM